MPYVDNDGIKIHYEIEGQGPPLVLHHGLTGSMQHFRDFGYTEPLRKKYKLILIDARGHGLSDKPHDPEAYRSKLMVKDVVSINDVGLGIGKYAASRFSSLIIGGMGSVEADSLDEIRARAQPWIKLYKQGPDVIISELEKTRTLSQVERDALRLNDWEAMVAIYSLQEHIGFESILHSLKIPCMFYAGDNDYWHSKSKKTADMIKDAWFISLPELDHRGAYRRSDLILPHIFKFLDNI
jgi:pimeloyl-ACP methyl ester carboxylesterase